MKRGKWRFLAGGVGLSLVLAGPIIGAGSTLFWSYAADGNGPQRVALQTYRKVMRFSYSTRHDDYRGRREQYAEPRIAPNDRQCEIRRAYRFDEGNLVLISALNLYRTRRLLDSFDEPGLNALAAVPPPILGAIAGCVEASILAGFCAQYVVRTVDTANLAESVALRDRRSVVERAVEQAWCAAEVPPARPSS